MAGGKPGGAGVFFGVETVAPAHPDLLVQQALDPLHHARIVLGDGLAHLERSVEEARGGNDQVQETDALGLFGRDDATGIKQFLRLRQANEQW